MAIMTIEVPDKVAKKFTPFTVVKWSDVSMQEELLKIDGDGWAKEIDFWDGVPAKEVLDYLDKING